ncbi:hypothetical protein EZV62_025717 [Acer yangbiense]|uniref:Uncharacterized protein n=1 Tax=Acer yangbiense TaxID=1000413 RepID=A0A5C7GZZ4_9ROSI|nr:hypothetical protein EZV62_025717 [Acer yangbiense]
MAFPTRLCKSASSLAPLTSRLVTRVNRYYHHSAVSIPASNHLNQKQILSSFKVPDFQLSTAAATKTMKSSVNKSVLRGLESEINSFALETNKDKDLDQVEETPSEFPFKIEDNSRHCNPYLLTREYHGELVKVDQVYKPCINSIRMVINVSKNDGNDGPSLEFDCTGTLDAIIINRLSFKNAKQSENSEDGIPLSHARYTMMVWPVLPLGGLDENLVKAFHRFLEIRGINPSFTGFLFEYMSNKDKEKVKVYKKTPKHLIWLKKMKSFIEA